MDYETLAYVYESNLKIFWTKLDNYFHIKIRLPLDSPFSIVFYINPLKSYRNNIGYKNISLPLKKND